MSNVRLYFDDDALDRRVVSTLRRAGLTATTANEVGNAGRDDEEHLRFSTARSEVLVSCNIGDFLALHTAWLRSGRSHSGIILVVQQRYSPGEVAKRIQRATEAFSAAQFVDRCEFLNHWG